MIVWRNPELSMAMPVRPDGKITTPLVDDLPAMGKTPTELERDIEKALGKFIRDPVVTVVVTQFVGPTNEQIRVTGEATKPQILAYRKDMTVLDVMIAVGGLTDFATATPRRSTASPRRQALQRSPARSDQARRHLGERRDASGRHPDHSAELVLNRPPSPTQTKTATHERDTPTHSPAPARNVASPLDRADVAWVVALVGIAVVYRIPERFEATAGSTSTPSRC